PGLSGGKARFAKPRPAGLGPGGGSGAAGDGGGGGGSGGDLAALVAAVRPSALIGAATVGGAFSSDVLRALAKAQPTSSSRPLVFALSNPTSKAECSFEEARTWTGGRAVFASGTQ
ncbi:NAD-dependent malic enzyme, mitochondrial, partial [Tetrabaena socialis]